MTRIAGLVYSEAGRPVDGPVRADLARRSRVVDPGEWLEASGAVLLVGGSDGVAVRLGDPIVAAELDVSNLEGFEPTSASRSAADGVARLLRRDGCGFANALRGAFAIAIWLPVERRLILAVDRFGFRRLYYAASAQGFAFSSCATGPLALPGIDSGLDPDAAYAYMNFATVPAPQTMYRAVRRLPPGHVLVWERGSTTIQPYWDVAYSDAQLGAKAAADLMVRQTTEAVADAVRGSEVKRAGAFLSGGTDSSTILGLMSKLTGERISAFSIGFREARYDELAYAELAARHFDAAHYSQIVTADDAFAAMPRLVEAYEEPFGNNSVIPTYLCARLARDSGMRLLLAGDGGDEIFGGNERYRREQILARYMMLPAPVRHGLIEPLLRAIPPAGLSPLGKAQRYVERATTPNPDRFYGSEFFVVQQRERLLHADFLGSVRPEWPLEIARRHYGSPATSDELNRLLYVDLKITLGDNDLFKVTRAAELAGVSVRFPMLDHPLVEALATLPSQYKIRGGEKRYLFKRAFAGLLPAEILSKVKHGFGLPISEWLKSHAGFRELLGDTLLSERCRNRGYFAVGALEDLVVLHRKATSPYYGDILWTLLMLELWHRAHGDRV